MTMLFFFQVCTYRSRSWNLPSKTNNIPGFGMFPSICLKGAGRAEMGDGWGLVYLSVIKVHASGWKGV